MTDEVVYRHVSSLKHHRDPGCRAFDALDGVAFQRAIDDGRIEVLARAPVWSKPCLYCYSAAGYKRFPG